MSEDQKKSKIAEREEEILNFWKENKIFEKSLKQTEGKKEFVFYEGPPTANGKPGIHHLEARAFKDAIPRYKTMQGFHVRRKGGWDTHGLPVELQVEKELGLKSKKEIEQYGIARFNKKCKESVWKYVDEWRKFTDRIGYWVDLDNPYITYDPKYIESLWAIVKKVHERGLLYKDYKVVPWCPRCGTALSSHELAQGYQDAKDISLYVKFKVKGEENTYLIAWTTTPWTLPGNVALAVGGDIEYKFLTADFGYGKETYIFAETGPMNRLLAGQVKIIYNSEKKKGRDLIGLQYEPLYEFSPKNENSHKVYLADFVTTEDGTGIVHTAVMYGQDDFALGNMAGLPKHHLVDETGHFKPETGNLSGKSVVEESTAVEILKDLQNRGLLFDKETYTHSYPFCWRCRTKLIYFARDSWYIKMSDLREKLIKENEKINWEPDYIKEGRFGEWLREVKDWAISRERYWGTPLPVWKCGKCGEMEVIGSFEELGRRSSAFTELVLVRHSESDKNIQGVYDSSFDTYPLTETGEAQAKKTAARLEDEGGIDCLYTSPVLRARETAKIIGDKLGILPEVVDDLREVESGNWDGKKVSDEEIVESEKKYFSLPPEDFHHAKRGETGESWNDVEERMKKALGYILQKDKGKKILLVSHQGPLIYLIKHIEGLNFEETRGKYNHVALKGHGGVYRVLVDSATGKIFDPHRPHIDTVSLVCPCGGTMNRVKEVMDVWFDSGAMPFAEDHWPFERRKASWNFFDGLVSGWLEKKQKLSYPADFISEAIDQTRGWFYTLHAIGILMGAGRAYKNVICLGHILDKDGKKMSKSLGNIVEPWGQIEKYGADALRFWMYSVNQPGESKNYDEKTVDEIVKKVFNLLSNVEAFYSMYKEGGKDADPRKSPHALDQWILALKDRLVTEVTEGLESFDLFAPTRAIKEFVADLSQWYIRRSRDRFKGDSEEDRVYALATTRHVLIETAKILAPFAPFFAENLYLKAGGNNESVHLEEWPIIKSNLKSQISKVLEDMEVVRDVVSQGLEARSKAGIKVRQPLLKLVIRNPKLEIRDSELLGLIRDEVNVKEVIFDDSLSGEVELDLEITPELREEGQVRELVRAVQDLRKEKKLNPADIVTLAVKTNDNGMRLLNKFEDEIKKATGLAAIQFEDAGDKEIRIDDLLYILSIR